MGGSCAKAMTDGQDISPQLGKRSLRNMIIGSKKRSCMVSYHFLHLLP